MHIVTACVRRKARDIVLLFVCTLALAASPTGGTAWAQETPAGDPTCDLVADPEVKFGFEMCSAHIGCALVANIKRECPATKRFFKKIGEKFSGAVSRPLTNNDVMDAAMRDVVSPVVKRYVAQASAIVQTGLTNPAAQQLHEFTNDSGKTVYQGAIVNTYDRVGPGVQISADGLMARGRYVNDQLNGPSQIINQDGGGQVGTFREGQMYGPAALVTPDGFTLEGDWINDKSIGMHKMTMPNGKSQMWLHDENGTRLARGPEAAAGQTPVPPPVPADVAARLEAKAAEMRQVAATPIVPVAPAATASAAPANKASAPRVGSIGELRAVRNEIIGPIVAGCGSGPVTGRVPGRDSLLPFTYTVTQWTGGCVDGLRDGSGIFASAETTEHTPGTQAVPTTMEEEVTFVRGRRVGLRCIRKLEVGNTFARRNFCSLETGTDDGSIGIGSYRKLADGRWQLVVPPLPGFGSYLPAGTLEALSDKLIADFKAGKGGAPLQVSLQEEAFDGLMSDGKIVFEPALQGVGIDSKRVAVIFSGRTVAEVARFEEAFLRFGASKPTISDEAFAAIVQNGDPKRITAALLAAATARVGQVVPADDLTVLRSGAADYAMVIDWSFEGFFAMTDEEFDRHPICPAPAAGECAPVFIMSADAYIIDKSLRVVRRVTVPMPYYKGPNASRLNMIELIVRHAWERRVPIEDLLEQSLVSVYAPLGSLN